MSHLTLLGTLDLVRDDGTSVDVVLRQPKNLVLLAYLTVAEPRGFHRRDSLLGLFWPELNVSRGRHALRQAVYRLRRALGPEVVRARGAEEIGIDPSLLQCDVVRFEEALLRGDRRRAMRLYSGDLLDGVYVPEASVEIERWVENLRARLRERAAEAAWQLAEEAAAASYAGEARHWGRRAVELSPEHESTRRRLITLYDAVGDGAAALEAYDDLRRWLEEEYGIAPSHESRALVDAVRTGKRSAPATVAPGGPVALHPQVADSDAGPPLAGPGSFAISADRVPGHGTNPATARGRPGRWRLPIRPLLRAALPLVVIMAGLVAWAGSGTADESRQTRMAVLPFNAAGDGEFAYLSDALVHLLSARLATQGAISVVDPHLVLEKASGNPRLNLGDAERLAVSLSADQFVLGTVVARSGRVRVGVSLYRSVSPAHPITFAAVEADSDGILDLANELSEWLAQSADREPPPERRRPSLLRPIRGLIQTYGATP